MPKGTLVGSSKQRRELINLEMDHIRSLLPIKEKSLHRLSQLEVMSMACIFVRRCHYLGTEQVADATQSDEALQVLSGFFLVCTADGKLIHVSNNITDYIGHSTIDITKQGDNIFDMVAPVDHAMLKQELSQSDSSREISLICRIVLSRYTRRQSSFFDEKILIDLLIDYEDSLCTSRIHNMNHLQAQLGAENWRPKFPYDGRLIGRRMKFSLVGDFLTAFTDHGLMKKLLFFCYPTNAMWKLHIRGHFVQPSDLKYPSDQAILIAMCTPVISPAIRPSILAHSSTVTSSVHSLDMTFISACDLCEHYLACNLLQGRSWYDFIYPENCSTASKQHMRAIANGPGDSVIFMTVMVDSTGNPLQVSVSLELGKQDEDDVIICSTQILESRTWMNNAPLFQNHTDVEMTAEDDEDICMVSEEQSDHQSMYHQESNGHIPNTVYEPMSTFAYPHLDPTAGYSIGYLAGCTVPHAQQTSAELHRASQIMNWPSRHHLIHPYTYQYTTSLTSTDGCHTELMRQPTTSSPYPSISPVPQEKSMTYSPISEKTCTSPQAHSPDQNYQAQYQQQSLQHYPQKTGHPNLTKLHGSLDQGYHSSSPTPSDHHHHQPNQDYRLQAMYC